MIFLAAIGAFLTTCYIYLCKKEGKYPTFGRWWDMEGIGYFALIALLYWLIGGCLSRIP